MDTSVWISLLDEEDSCNERARNIVRNICYQDLEIMDHLYAEILTVLRNKISDQQCYRFSNFLKNAGLKITLITREVLNLANFVFFKSSKLSFTDCLLIASAKLSGADLVTFDKNLEKEWNKVRK